MDLQYWIPKVTTQTLCILSTSLFLSANPSWAENSVDMTRLKKATGEISQVGVTDSYAQGVIVGNGCYVVANFHSVFGKSKNAEGRVELIEDETISVGHVVDFRFDLDDTTGSFAKSVKLKVLEFGTYDDESTEGRLGDKALLEIVDCPRGGYTAGHQIDSDLPRDLVPMGVLVSVGTRRVSGRVEYVVENGCRSAFERMATHGLLLLTCDAYDGGSGRSVMMVGPDGSLTYAGMISARAAKVSGPRLAIALHPAVIADMFIARFGTNQSARWAGPRKPQ